MKRNMYVSAKVIGSHVVGLMEHLRSLGNQFPRLWCFVNEAGLVVLENLIDTLKKPTPTVAVSRSDIEVVGAHTTVDEGVQFTGTTSPESDFRGKNVLVICNVVHTGDSLRRVIDAIHAHAPRSLLTYSVFVKRRARQFPQIWGLLLNDHDRVVFIDTIRPHNTAILESHKNLTIRLLTENDLHAPKIRCGVRSLDRISWADRYYDMVNSTDERGTYLLIERRRIIGYLTCHLHRPDCMMLDEIAVSRTRNGRGYGGVLMKWFRAFVNAVECRSSLLWSVRSQVQFYEKYGYRIVPDEIMNLDGEEYVEMLRRIAPEYSGFFAEWMP